MKPFVTSVVLIIQAIAMASAFSANHKVSLSRACKVSLNYHPETFERAVDCANNYGMCNVDELLNLAKGQVIDILMYYSLLKT